MHEPAFTREHPSVEGGIQWIYDFDNLYGASVISLPPPLGIEGKFEVAVMDMVTGSPIGNALRGLEIDDVEKILDEIEKMPKREDGVTRGSV